MKIWKEESTPGLKSNEDEILILDKCIYGLVQSAHQYCEKVVRILKQLGFTGGDVDTCLFDCRSIKGAVFITLNVDYNLMILDTAAINEAI